MEVIRYIHYKEEDVDPKDIEEMIKKDKENKYLVLEANGKLHHLGKVYEVKK